MGERGEGQVKGEKRDMLGVFWMRERKYSCESVLIFILGVIFFGCYTYVAIVWLVRYF